MFNFSPSKTLAVFVVAIAMVFLANFVVWAWTEPASAPPSGNVPSALNEGSLQQTKTGNLILHDLYMNANAGDPQGDIYAINWLVGYDDIFLKSNSAENSTIFLGGAQVDFWSGGAAKWRIDSSGTLTLGSVPWTRLTSFPSACAAGQYVSAIGSALTCSTPAGGSGGAPTSASYLVMALDGTLTAERALVAGNGLSLADGGANNNVTLNVGTGQGITVNADTIQIKDCAANEILKRDAGDTDWICAADATGGGAATPGGSNGAVQFNSASSFGGDAATFFWDNTNKRLGVGTNAPAVKLEVSAAADELLRLTRSGATNPTTFRIGTDSGMVISNSGIDTMYLKNGFVGIGTAYPGGKLGVESDNVAIYGSSVNGYAVYGTTNCTGAMCSGVAGINNSSGSGGVGVYGMAKGGVAVYGGGLNAGSFDFYGAGPTSFFAGNVGIGTGVPGAKLEVTGQVKITGGSPGVGKVLTSDASGLASWQTPIGGANYWTLSGTNIYNNNTGYVGIGTASPNMLLTVINSSAEPDILIGSDTTNRYGYIGYNPTDNFFLLQGGVWGGTTRNIVLQGGGGYVSIGTTSLGGKLTVESNNNSIYSSSVNGYAVYGATDCTGLMCAGVGGINNNNGIGIYGYSKGYAVYGQGSGAGSYDFYGAGPTSFFAGNVGIGTGMGTPGAKLDINGNVRIRSNLGIDAGTAIYLGREESFGGSDIGGSDYGYISFENDNNNYAYWGDSAENSAFIIGSENDGTNNNSDILVLKGKAANIFDSPNNLFVSGNVGIGTASPGYKLDVTGDIRAQNAWLRTTGNTGWYSDTWGGGWYMSDGTWIRAYNNKNIYTGGSAQIDGNLTVGGQNVCRQDGTNCADTSSSNEIQRFSYVHSYGAYIHYISTGSTHECRVDGGITSCDSTSQTYSGKNSGLSTTDYICFLSSVGLHELDGDEWSNCEVSISGTTWQIGARVAGTNSDQAAECQMFCMKLTGY